MSAMQPPSPERAGSERHSACLLPCRSIGSASQPWRILDDDLANGADRAFADQPPSFANEGITGVGIGQAERRAGTGDDPGKLARLVEGRGHRLVAHDRDPGPERRPRGREMKVVRRRDGHEVDAVVPPGFGGDHRLDGRIGALRIESVASAGLERARRIAAERAGDKLDLAVHLGCEAMHGADERPGPAADQSHPDPPHRSPPPRRLTSPGRAASPCGPWQAPEFLAAAAVTAALFEALPTSMRPTMPRPVWGMQR